MRQHLRAFFFCLNCNENHLIFLIFIHLRKSPKSLMPSGFEPLFQMDSYFYSIKIRSAPLRALAVPPGAAPLRGAAAGRCLLCKGTACGAAATLQLHRRNVPCAAAPRRQGRRGLQPCGGQDIAPSAGALPLVPGGRVRRVALNTSLASRAVNGRPADQLPAGQLRYNWYLAA